jgi:hypothetical protein
VQLREMIDWFIDEHLNWTIKRSFFMSVESHIVELNRKHSELEKRIAETKNHPSHDPLELVDLKRRKLLLKDEIERMKDATRH